MTDEEIIQELRNGKEKNFRRVYKKLQSEAKAYLRKYFSLLDEDDKADVIQESELILWENISLKDFKLTSKLSTWFLGVCKNIAKKFTRNKQREPLINPGYESFTVVERITDCNNIEIELIKDEIRSFIDNVIAELNVNCQRLLTLIYFENKSYKEIVAESDVYKNEDSAKTASNKCRSKARNIIITKYPDEYGRK